MGLAHTFTQNRKQNPLDITKVLDLLGFNWNAHQEQLLNQGALRSVEAVTSRASVMPCWHSDSSVLHNMTSCRSERSHGSLVHSVNVTRWGRCGAGESFEAQLGHHAQRSNMHATWNQKLTLHRLRGKSLYMFNYVKMFLPNFCKYDKIIFFNYRGNIRWKKWF